MNWKIAACRTLIALAGLACVLPSASAALPEILVLSNRADLISGGDALVEVKWPAGTNLAAVRVVLNGSIVTSSFAMRPNGRYMGLVTGLKNGNNILYARYAGGASQIAINNHPIGGPVFAGAHLQPWICARTTATVVTVTVPGGGPGGATLSANATTKVSGLDVNPVDEDCNAPSKYTYYYQPVTKPASCTFTVTGGTRCFEPYTARPADADIADFTNDRGDTVKSLIRVERGVVNRGIYELVTFYDPAVPSAPWAPQKGWNGKLLWKFGASSSYSRFQNPPATAASDDTALRRGYMVASSSMTDHSLNANDTLGAETMMMVKERIIETYGQVRYTMGNGCSGGSIYQYQVAAAYPGLLDGIQPTCTFPDTFTTGIEVGDCGLLAANYYTTPNGAALSVAKRNAINGHTAAGFCTTWVSSFLPNGNPSNGNCGSGFPAALIYHPTLRPGGVRCTGSDHSAGIFGKIVDTDGNTKTPSPTDNEGVQYGLKALAAGTINAEEFVRVNEGVGSYTLDQVWIPPTRKSALASTLHTIYSAGIVSDGKPLGKVAIIDLRGDEASSGCIHANWRPFEARARLDKANGHHDNHVIWGYTGGGAASPGTALALKSFLTMDTWLANIESDPTANPLEVKVVNNKPADAHDLCLTTNGGTAAQVAADVGLGTPACPITYGASPRQAAGGPLSEDVFKCTLKPLNFTAPEYNGVVFSSDQQNRLMAAFPNGVCDWSQPGVEQVPANPWTTFAAGPGGQPLGPPPVSVPYP